MYLPPSGKHYYSGIVLAFNTLVSKHMQATVKENSYWPGIGTAVDAVDQACKVCQQCKITAVKKYGKISLPTHQFFKKHHSEHLRPL